MLLRKFIFGCVAFAATCFAAINAGGAERDPFEWQFAGWYGGGCYPNVEFDWTRKGRVFLVSDVAGLWRSDDNGDHWAFITKGLNNLLVTQLKVSPQNPDVVYAGTGAGVSISLDGGNHWASLDNLKGRINFQRPQSYRSIWVDEADDRSLCVGTSGGDVFCSANQGRDWEDLHIPKSGTESSAVVALYRLKDKSGLLAARVNGISIYSYAMRKWVSATPLTGVSDVIPYRGVFLAASGGKIWSSDERGEHWSPIKGAQPGSVFRLEQDPTTNRIYAARNNDWSGNVFYSNDDFTSWEALGDASRGDIRSDPTRAWATAGSAITALKASPFDADVLFRTDWWGVWRSSDGGQTWQEKIVGTPNVVGTDIALSDGGTVFASAMDNGLLKSGDGGSTYTSLFPASTYKDDENGHVWRIVIPSPNQIIATSSPWSRQINQVLLSEDGGKTFKKIRAGLPEKRPVVNTLWGQGYPRVLAVDPNNSKRIYLGIDGDDGGGLFISEDGARTWALSSGQPPSRKIYSAFVVDREKPGYLYWGTVGNTGGIYRSTDGGRSWAPSFLESRAIFDMTTAADGAIYATGAMNGGAVFASRDHGESWNVLVHFPNTETTKAIAVSPADPRILVTSTLSWGGTAPQKFYLSKDGGAMWTDITGNLPDGSGAAAFAFNRDGSLLYMSRHAGGVYKLSTDQFGAVK